MKSNYIFIGDLVNFEEAKHFDLGYGHILQRAKDIEIEIIRKQLKSYFEISHTSSYFNRYEQIKRYRSETNYNIIKISNPQDFKYSVIRIPPNWISYYESINLVLNIAEFDITSIFLYQYLVKSNPITNQKEIVPGGSIAKKLSHSMYHYFDFYGGNFSPKIMTLKIAEDIKSLHTEIYSFLKQKDEFPHIYKAISDFNSHKEISRSSPFKLIVLLSCLEGLITDGSHSRTNSINRQLQSKLNLINNRCSNPIDFNDYIKGPNTLTFEKIIESIYTYRSKIAHGDFVEFKKTLAILERVEFQKIIDFLIQLSKKVMRFAIKEPQLIVDIKNI